jgi:putative glutamine amidotransferase
MLPRIAIPVPHSLDREYAERAIVKYDRAVAQAGGEPVRITLGRRIDELREILEGCGGVLLPGSKADVDPAKYGAERSPHSAAADVQRDAVDTLLLEEAYRTRKPVLGICYGLQSLNVFRSGSLVQHIPDFLPNEPRARVNHEAGRKVPIAHAIEIKKESKLAQIVFNEKKRKSTDKEWNGGEKEWKSGASAPRERNEADGASALGESIVLPVNSSHHQSVDKIGKGLMISARCPDDGIIEALEGTAPDHFVLAVQWHPERSIDEDPVSRAIFRALIDAAKGHTK